MTVAAGWRSVQGQNVTTKALSSALSADEIDELCDFLDAHAELDFDGLLGLLHAVAVAPSMLAPSIWLPVVLGEDGFTGLTQEAASTFIGLLMRQYNDVLDAFRQGMAIIPPPEDVDACESFAFGYVAGAEIDPEWIGDDARWTFAAPFAYLAGRFDLVPETMLKNIESGPDPEGIIRRDMGGVVAAASRSFARDRASAFETPAVSRPGRVGRNEPCPCGSGRKFKRCCAGRGAAGAAS